jgi:hypothetical protein
MEINEIDQKGTWGKAAGAINTNFAKINVAIKSLQDVTILNKGYFKTEEELVSTHSRSIAGAKAYVGSAYPYKIYLWSHDDNAWIDSGEFGGEEQVNLGNYYTKEETIAKEEVLREEVQEDYDSKIANVNATIENTKVELQNDVDDKIADVRDDYDNVMTQEAYDAIEVKEDKFYFIYEEE